jgi:hypothetical protein
VVAAVTAAPLAVVAQVVVALDLTAVALLRQERLIQAAAAAAAVAADQMAAPAAPAS